jgi:hypothetical protein
VISQYDYEALGPDAFQQLCQALLVRTHKYVQCLPVGMPDGGRDAVVPRDHVSDAVIYQIKFRKPTPNSETSPDDIVAWIQKQVRGETEKIERLITKGAARYILMTNARCSAHEGVGTRDRVQDWLNKNISIPTQVWWRDDIDRRLDPETEIKRTYGLLRDISGLAELLGVTTPKMDEHENLRTAKTDPRVSALMKYMRCQYLRDRVLKFKQTELEPELLDVFVDVPAEGVRFQGAFVEISSGIVRLTSPASQRPNDSTMQKWKGLLSRHAQTILASRRPSTGLSTASLLLGGQFITNENEPEISQDIRMVIEGAPGQGKSTISQYVCQAHRARLLGMAEEVRRFPPLHMASPLRLPFHVDLRDLSSWLKKEDPFDVTNNGTPAGWAGSLESFLAAQVRKETGGNHFTVADLDAVTSATPTLLMLDGLDEVPDLTDRKNVISAVNETVARISLSCPSLMTVITSRPSGFAKTPGFSHKEYLHLSLTDLPLPLVLQYTDGWLHSKEVAHQEAHEIRKVLGEKLGHPHIVDLARNPMQLAILLWLVKRKGPSLPDKRTALYGAYMDTFLDREAEKSSIVRDERDLLLELHGFIAWELHCQAEEGKSRGRIPENKLKSTLKRYLHGQGYKKSDLIDQLFAGMTQRVMMLTSRVEGTFEFEVQPLREYFAARYLYSTARVSQLGSERRGSRSDRFEALIRNPYWWNVTRFFAGFSDKGELANLVDLVEALHDDGDFSLVSYPREVSATLLGDHVFSQRPRSAVRIFERVTTPDSIALLLASRGLGGERTSFGEDGGDICAQMQSRIEKSLAHGMIDGNSVSILQQNGDRIAISSWWLDLWARASNTHTRRQLLAIANDLGVLSDFDESTYYSLYSKVSGDTLFWRILLENGYSFSPQVGSASYEGLMRALRDSQFYFPHRYFGGPQVTGFAQVMSGRTLMQVALLGRREPRLIHEVRRFLSSTPRIRIIEDLSSVFLALVDSMALGGSLEDWQSAHDEYVGVLGGECRNSKILGLRGGFVRSNSIARSRGGALLDENLPIVYRARYARQRRGDNQWWKSQIATVESNEDAWFIITAMLCFNPGLIDSNARALDRWVRNFDFEDIVNLWIIFNSTNGGRMSVTEDQAVLRGVSHQMQFICVLSSGGAGFRARLNNAIRKSKTEVDFAALYANIKLMYTSWAGTQMILTHLDEVRDDVRTIQKGTYLPAEIFMYERKISNADSRLLMQEPGSMAGHLLTLANRKLMASLSTRATPLSAVARKEGWFAEE